MSKINLIIIIFITSVVNAVAQFGTPITKGMRLSESTAIRAGIYNIFSDSVGAPILTIEGNNLTIDFLDVMLNGAKAGQLPDSFSGLGILIKNSKNIKLKNLKVKGFKVAVFAENVENLEITNSDFSYNFRQKLYSIRERENFQDWMSYHNNENDEWLRYGAGLYLKNCNNTVVKNCKVTQGQNGIMMTKCNDGLFYNNTIEFNSGIGIGLYRSNRNRVMHNQMNFNVRGYSHGFYSRGQDSAGILVYEQSNDNIFAYNTATHSGDGFFLWAGQQTMDSGKGGCNGNLLYDNNFSFSPTNGIEVTFSSNKIVNNKMDGCTYAIWAGYSFNTQIIGNHIYRNKYGIAIEHGQYNTIECNNFGSNDIGIQLWERLTQPGDWGYAKNRDIHSYDYAIRRNIFQADSIPLKISHSKKVAINDDNQFINFQKLLAADAPNEQLYVVKNDLQLGKSFGDAPTDIEIKNRISKTPKDISRIQSSNNAYTTALAPERIPDGIQPQPTLPGDRSLIRVNEWGPYNYQYPSMWLDSIIDDNYYFTLLAPDGNWRIKQKEGFWDPNLVAAANATTLIAKKISGAVFLSLELEFIGNESITTQLGTVIPKKEPIPVKFARTEKALGWELRWYEYTDATDPLKDEKAFEKLKLQSPLKTEIAPELAYVWWNKPASEVPADRFATFANATFEVPKGKYRLVLTSDDGARLYLDKKLILQRWTIHESMVDEMIVELNGKHTLEIEHFDVAGLSNLEFRLEKIW